MTARNTPVPLEQLLAHGAWVRRLAVALTRDESSADDVVQQTWLAALRAPPRTDASPRGWLATVVRNAVRERGRSAARRRHREAVVARRDATHGDDPSDVTVRAELQAAVTAAVVALDEPYRRAILLRHFDDLPVADVARRMEAPLETTRARLRRGRALLRTQLAGTLGHDQPLARALLPLTVGRASSRVNVGSTIGGTAAGGTLMVTKIGLATAIALLLGLGLWWGLAADSATRGTDGTPPQTALVEAVATRAQPSAGSDTVAVRARVRAGSDAPSGAVIEPDERADAESGEPGEHGTATAMVSADTAAGVPAKLRKVLDVVEFENATSREILAQLSARLGVPIAVDARAVAVFDSGRRTSMQMLGTTGGDALRLLAPALQCKVTVEAERVVFHPVDLEWHADLPAQVIAPVSPSVAAPTSIRVEGRVVDMNGAAVSGALILGGMGRPPRSGEDGAFTIDLIALPRQITARRAGYVKSPPFAVIGEYGETVQATLVIAPAATVVVRVTGADKGDAPEGLSATFEWEGGGDTYTAAGNGTITSRNVAPGSVRIDITAPGHAPATREVTVAAGTVTDIDVALRVATLEDRLRETRASFDVTGERLGEVLADCAKAWGVRIAPTRGLAEKRYWQPVTLRVVDDSAAEVLRALCELAELKYRTDDESDMVWIEAR